MAQRQQATGLILRYIKRTDSGSINYRRVIPEPLRQIIGRREFKRKIGETLSEATRNYGEADREFGLLIRTAQRASSKKHLEAMQAKLTRLQVAERARREYQDLIQSTVWIGGEEFPLTDSDAVSFVADVMQDHPSPEARSNPVKATQERLVIGSLRTGEQPHAPATVQDAYRIYRELKIDGKPKEALAIQGLDRIMGYLGSVLKLDQPLASIRRTDARAVIDHLSNDKGQKPATIRRNVNVIKAMFSLALREFELEATNNPFAQLEIKGEGTVIDQRHPFTEAQINAISARIRDHVEGADLLNIWRILAGTGCRLAEVTGLLVDDGAIKEDGLSYLNRPFCSMRLWGHSVNPT